MAELRDETVGANAQAVENGRRRGLATWLVWGLCAVTVLLALPSLINSLNQFNSQTPLPGFLAEIVLRVSAIVLAVLVAVWIARDRRQVTQGTGVTRHPAGGHLDELAALAATINNLTQRLQQREHEQQQTEAALQASETRFARTFTFSPFALAITRLADGRMVDLNTAFERLTGYTREEALGRTPDELALWVDPQQRTEGLMHLRTGALIVNFEATFRMKDGSHRTCVLGGGLVTMDEQPCVVTSLMDITERKQAEVRARLLAQVGELVRQMTDPDAFLYTVAQALGEYLGAQRSFFVELDSANDRGFIQRDYHPGVPSVAGSYRLSAYSAVAMNEMAQGRTVVNRDSQLDPRTAAYYEQTYAPNGERAYVAVPLMRDGDLVAALWLSTDQPRDWPAEDVTLLETAAERAWQALERARLYQAEQAARADLEVRVRERTAELEQSSAQLSNLSARLQATREEERQRLSRELHDQLGGALTGLKIDVTHVRRHVPEGDAQAKLKDLLTAIDEMIQMVRQLAMELRPAVLDDFGLAAALEWQLEEFEKRSGIRGRFISNEITVELDKDTAIGVFRIFQETLTNVVRHAQATEVEVRLEQQADSLLLEVHDNGRGINASDLAQADGSGVKSLGVVGMRERVRLFSGTLEFEGAADEGTTVRVRIPLGK